MRTLILIAALALASASAQAGDSRSLSTGATTNDVTATTKPQPKPGALSAQTDGAAAPALAPQAAETPRYAPPPGAETPRYAAPPAEAAKPVDATRNTAETPAQIPVQTPAQTPVETQVPRYTARPAPVDDGAVAATPPSRQHTPSREARYRHGRNHHAGYYGSDYGRPHFRTHRWSAWRIIATLHRYGFYW